MTLRFALNDPLFVSEADGLVPTAAARAIGPRVASVLKVIDVATGSATSFDPATSTRKFSIYVSEVFALDLVPRIAKAIGDTARRVQLELRSLASDHVSSALADGRIEFAVGHFPGSIHFDQLRMFDDHYALLVSNRHPVKEHSIGAGILATMRLARIESDLEAANQLHSMALEAHIRVTVPNATTLPTVLIGSDLAAMLPSRTARRLAAGAPLRVIHIDPQRPSFPISIQWKWRAEADLGSLWLRRLIHDVANDDFAGRASKRNATHRAAHA